MVFVYDVKQSSLSAIRVIFQLKQQLVGAAESALKSSSSSASESTSSSSTTTTATTDKSSPHDSGSNNLCSAFHEHGLFSCFLMSLFGLNSEAIFPIMTIIFLKTGWQNKFSLGR